MTPRNLTIKTIKPQGMTDALWLETLGVPAAFREAVIKAANDRTPAGDIVLGITMVAVVIGTGAAAIMGLDAFVRARAVALAVQTGAPLVHVDVGAGPFVLLFGLIMVMGWASSVRAGRHRVNGVLRAAGLFQPPTRQFGIRWVMQRLLTGSVRRAAGAATVDDFLRGVAAHQARGWGIAAVVLVMPALVLTALETDHFWVAGPAGIVERRMFPPFSSRTHDPGTATTLTTGCNHTDDDERLIYDVGFATGDDFDLGSTEAVSGSKLAAIEAIDARLGTGAVRGRWSHLERDPLHPTCLDYWARQFDSDGRRRLTRLMRLTGP